MKEHIRKSFEDVSATVKLTEEHLASRIAEAVDLIVASYRAGGGVFTFGNGGSAVDAQHIVGELVGRFMKERPGLRAEALSANIASLTSIANDYDYEAIFARQLEANAGVGDVAIGLSTSGNSPNVLVGLAKARELGMKTIAMTGSGGGKCAELADVLLDVPTHVTPRAQELHTVIYHIICELVEEALS